MCTVAAAIDQQRLPCPLVLLSSGIFNRFGVAASKLARSGGPLQTLACERYCDDYTSNSLMVVQFIWCGQENTPAPVSFCSEPTISWLWPRTIVPETQDVWNESEETTAVGCICHSCRPFFATALNFCDPRANLPVVSRNIALCRIWPALMSLKWLEGSEC